MAAVPLVNPGFETGDLTGWTAPAGVVTTVDTYKVYAGTYSCNFYSGSPGVVDLEQTDSTVIWEGVQITASCHYRQGAASDGHNTGQIVMKWYDGSDAFIGEAVGNVVKKSGGNNTSSVTATAPSGAAGVRLGLRLNKNRGDSCGCDDFKWDLAVTAEVTLTFPTNGSAYNPGDSVPFRCTVTTGVPVTSVEYIATDTNTAVPTSVGVSTTAPYNINYSALPTASYSVVAKATLTNGTVITSAPNIMTIGAPPAPDTREYKASNAYTYLIASNFAGIANAVPSTARVVGMKTIIDYNVKALIRSKDKGVDDPTVARYQAAFDMVPSLTFETILLDNDGASYTATGSTMTGQGAITRSDFLVGEDGTSDGKRWTVLQSDAKQVEVGAEDELFGTGLLAASDFFVKSIGVRAYPNLAPKPSYADTGDACFRINLDKLRIQVYFDPGSVEYYFVSPDQTKVIKGKLVHFCVDKGDFRTGDAEGTLQFEYVLELKDGTQKYIGPDWTIHSEYPPTDANRIADVVPSELNDTVGMDYNGLPTQAEIVANNSRYEFISHNFYGDKDWDAIYGVNGVDKAFSYNGDWFYKICTIPDAEKDKPRHVAHHHQHLALGFEDRVDISVVGQPYNYSGFDGASSWAIGDKVTGLLPLSGTILGIFANRSIWGLSGTTVDNFATQVLVPAIGAIEYTIVDMGYPVYANAYGIYTLAQTQQYGDYLGTPMSVDVSPWLRPRLIKAGNSAIGTVVAWPVRSKNQYKLCFKDGYILTMTINAGQQAAPTFSRQRYDITS